MPETTDESWSDAWFLAAHGAGRRPRSLAEIIGEGDYIGHAIFTPNEIEHAVRRLVAGGLLIVDGTDSFRATPAGQALYEEATRHQRLWSPTIGRLASALDAAVPLRSHATGWSIDSRVYQAAYQRYSEELQRWDALPSALRAVLLRVWLVIIRFWQAFRR